MIPQLEQRRAEDLNAFVRDLEAAGSDLTAVLRRIAQARPLFAASDVSVALHDPRAEVAGPGSPWFAGGIPDGLAACLRDPMEGHLPLRALRRLGIAAARVEEFPGRMSDYGKGSAYARTLAAAGRPRVLIGHVGDGQSLGRIEWYRTSAAPPFDEGDEIRLRLLLPALASAYRACSRTIAADREVALINAAGAVLWTTDGFRFLWNSACGSPITDGRMPLAGMLDEPMFARPLALQVLNLADPSGEVVRGHALGSYRKRGRRVAAEWSSLPGGPFGCVGRVMLLELSRGVEVVAGAAGPGSTSVDPVERRRTS